jgi:heme o synthase
VRDAVTALSERQTEFVQRLPAAALRARLGAYIALTKPRIIELLLVTTVPAMMRAARGWPSWRLLLFTLLGGTLAAGAANVFNCYYDRDIDKLMHRTQRRPLPSGTVSPRAALTFGIVLSVTSVVLLAVTTTVLAAALAAGAIFYYAVLYTIVAKRHTRRSTELGGVPGAAPVLIGWAAVTGSLDWPPLVFFGVVFCWQMPHFWALAMRFREDYARAGVPMLPVVAGPRETKKQMLLYTVVLWPVSLAPWLLGLAGPVYAISVGMLSLAFTGTAIAVWRDPSDRSARHMFAFSLLYLFLIFTVLLADHLSGGGWLWPARS